MTRNTHTQDSFPNDDAVKPQPVTAELRARVKALHAEGLGRNAIAREVEVSGATVTKIAREFDPPLAFDRAQTAIAVRARQIDLAVVREELARKFLVAADDSLDSLEAPVVLGNFGGSENTYNETLLDAPTIEQRATLVKTAVAAAAKGIELLKVDAASGSVSARGVVIELRDALTEGIRQMEQAGIEVDPTVTPDENTQQEEATS